MCASRRRGVRPGRRAEGQHHRSRQNPSMLGQSVRAPARGMTCSLSFTLLAVRQPKNGVSLVTYISPFGEPSASRG